MNPAGTPANGRSKGNSSARRCLPARIELCEQLPQKSGVGLSAGEVPAAAQHQCLVQRLLEAVMPLLHVAVLVALTRLNGLALQAVVPQQRLIALLELLRLFRSRLHRRGQPIGAVRCGTPPSSHKAFCSPSLRLSRLSEKQMVPVSQLEYVSTKW